MSTSSGDALTLSCPTCRKTLRLPGTAAGKSGKCPACQTVFKIPLSGSQSTFDPPPFVPLAPTPSPAETSPPQNLDLFGYVNDPAPAGPAVDPTYQAFGSDPLPKPAPPAGERGSFRMAKKGIDNGVLGGLGMIALSVVWFFAGFFLLNRIFFYPIILFVFGIYAVIKGLATGNFRGNGRK